MAALVVRRRRALSVQLTLLEKFELRTNSDLTRFVVRHGYVES